jgi:peptidoglycan/xylan/chitin deacetylase (PgdA/CDA1 family)
MITGPGGETAAAALTIVGYHYVRPIAASRYPAIKGLEVAAFRSQMSYFDRHYHFVSIEDVVASVEEGATLPDRPLLLTFDDGYIDHYAYAFPILREFGARGAFYPTTAAVLEHRVLDANKIHFILASVQDCQVLVDAIELAIAAAPGQSATALQDYRGQYWVGNRFDSAPVLYCKQLLQHALPEPLRRRTVDDLFARFVTRDESSFAAGLYLGVSELQEMVAAGMHVGGHGGRHAWLDRLPAEEQQQDIDDSLRLLRAVWDGEDRHCFTFCYPYGGYNDATLDLLRERNCRAGLTVRPDLAYPDRQRMLELPRLDTTDFPTDPSEQPGLWTVRAHTNERRDSSRSSALAV